MKKYFQNQTNLLLIIILIASLAFRLYRIDFPKGYVFDEVYYPFTAVQYLQGNHGAWLWSSTAPDGHAFAWVNPPMAQETMAISMAVFHTTENWAARIPGVGLGVLAIYFVFLLAKDLFKNDRVALLSAFLFSIDGLNLVQSRTAMLDIYLTTFCLASLYFYLRHKPILSAVFLGLAFANKWTAIYLLVVLGLHSLKKSLTSKNWRQPIAFALIIPIVYLLIYIPFFVTGHSLADFIELVRQEWWYHTHLQATHNYASSWWSWPLNLYPVWFYVQYYPNSNWMANIFSSGNPLLFWIGTWGMILTMWDFWKERASALLWIISGFLLFWIPWAISPRIMFIYYFCPAVPFLCIALAYQFNKLWQNPENRFLVKVMLGMIVVSFILVFPWLTGIPLPKPISLLFFLSNLAKNPF